MKLAGEIVKVHPYCCSHDWGDVRWKSHIPAGSRSGVLSDLWVLLILAAMLNFDGR